MKSASGKRTLSSIVLLVCCAVLASSSPARAQITADIHVKLRPILERIDLVTDINAIGDTLYVCTQPGLLLRKNLATPGTTTYTVVLDLRTKVGMLGDRIPALPGLGYPVPGTYDERGLLGFAADPHFRHNGRFWVWYTAINEHSPNPPGFFQWLVSTTTPWNQAEYDHVGHVEEYQLVGGVAEFRRTLLNIKRPYFNHTGFQSLHWSPDLHTLVLALGDGGSEYDPNNISQDDRQLSGKVLKIDLGELKGMDFTGGTPVATFADLAAQGVPAGAFTPLLKGMRNPSKVHYLRIHEGEGERGGDDGEGRGRDEDEGRRFIKVLANTGQDTIEWIHAFDHYGLNFGFRPWEGIFPTSFEIDDTRVIAYGLEASRLPNFYRPFVEYTHLDPVLAPNANTGSAIFHGRRFPGLDGQVVFTDWITFARTPKQGLLMHAPIGRLDLQQVQPIHLFDVDLSEVGLTPGQVIFYTSINTNESGERIFIGGFKDIQYIVNQRENPPGGSGLAGGLYEVIPE